MSEDTKPLTITRPSLIADLRSEHVPPPAARWNIPETSLRPVPPFYPPLNPKCTVFVGDTMPSVVAVRIAECLRKRSIVAEFDEESHTATCMTMDRVHFTIHLYRGEMRAANDPRPDFSLGVIVECMRVRGDVISFHYTTRAILRAASGLSDGADTRSITSPLEVPNAQLARPRLSRKRKATSNDCSTGLEEALSLLKKDRICAQRLGLESLVMLTDETASGKDLSVYCSQVILGAGNESTGAHAWVCSLIEERIAPGETVEVVPEHIESSNTSVLEDSTVSSGDSTALPVLEDSHHGGVLRALALRTFANALSVLSKYEPASLESILSGSSPFVTQSFLAALVEDLAGASRPPAIVAGTRLASPHEAALAAMCLGILCKHSETVAQLLVPPNQEQQPVLDALDKARSAGLASNSMLAAESERAFLLLSANQDPKTPF